MSHPNARIQAADLIIQVQQGASLTALLQNCVHPEKSFIQALCFEVLRHYETLDWQVHQLLERPLPKNAKLIQALCLIGLYQLQDQHTAEHAAINETVKAVGLTKQASFKGLVNAILRRYQRERDQWALKLQADPARFNCPAWLLKAYQSAWPQHWEQICQAQAKKPPMSLRVNLAKTSREAVLDQVKGQAGLAESCVILDQACEVHGLPGFEEAWISVQDQAGQFIPGLLPSRPYQRILDACAAPGSKLAHLAEVYPNAEFTAIELDKDRIKRLEENIHRHQIKAKILHVDAREVTSWWDNQGFDLILLDAPCSATGVIRRHPDIKLLRQPKDIKALQETQLQLLNALWPTLKPGGVLLYTTCSVLPEENDAVIGEFIRTHSLQTQDLSLPVGQRTQYGWQILPGEGECDGFYYASLSPL